MFAHEDFDDKIRDQEWDDHLAQTHAHGSDEIDGAGMDAWDEKWALEEAKLNFRAYEWLAQKIESGQRQFPKHEWAMILGAVRERQSRFAVEARFLSDKE